MSPLATISAAWAALYAYLCAYYCVLHARRRTDREYLAFGLLSGAMSVYALGGTLFVDADSVAAAAMAQQIQMFGLMPAVAFYVDFAHHVVGRPRSGWTRAAYGLAAVGVVANVAGLFVDPGVAAAPDRIILFSAAPLYMPYMHPVGGALMAVALLAGLYGTMVLGSRASQDPDVRTVLAGGLLVMLAALHDAAIRLSPLHSVFLLEHSYFLFGLAVSYVLLGRFVRTANALTSRTLELRRSYNELRDAQEELLRKEQLATMGELSAVIAHEVRNPLAIIKNAVSSLHRPSLRDADRQVLLKILDEEADRLNRLVSDLLAYARPVTPQRQSIDVPEMVRGAVELARNAAQRDHELTYELNIAESANHTVQGDPDLLRQALVNVAENAIQAMPDGGTLTVRTYDTTLDSQPAIACAFRDTGEGMDTLVRSKASDPFFTTRPTGTGLGLAIVHRLVHSHGGKVQIESSYGTGTTVTLILPRRSVSRMPPPPNQAAAPASS